MNSCCDDDSRGRVDYLLYGSLVIVVALYMGAWILEDAFRKVEWLRVLSDSIFEIMNTIWWGILVGFLMVALLSKVPKTFVISVMGVGGGLGGILRAAVGGVLLDMCSHGILMVAAKLYERGVSGGQVIAFLVASPWNSFSLMIILIAMIGLPWTLAFIVLSMVIAVITGLIYEWLVGRGTLVANPNRIELSEDFDFWKEARAGLRETRFDIKFFKGMLVAGIMESRMVLRWILFGVVMAALVRTFVDTGTFQEYFGPTLAGLGLTLLAATIIEVCSEGSTPIAADLLTRANAPGNSFAFLMAGAASDYTEVMVLKDATRSWKFALFLPLITFPQVIVIAWAVNQVGS